MEFVITGVWFEHTPFRSKHISHVLLNKVINDKIEKGIKESELYVIGLLDLNYTIHTCLWDYKNSGWIKGALVTDEQIGLHRNLRTVRNSKVTDNLDNLINMQSFPI